MKRILNYHWNPFVLEVIIIVLSLINLTYSTFITKITEVIL